MNEVHKKKGIAYIFSGTGNTLTAGKMLQSSLEKYEICLDIFRVAAKNTIVPDPNAYDLTFFAYPIHAFNSPRFFLRFVKKLPVLNPDKQGMPAYIFKTSGEPFYPNHASSFTLCRLLKKKGFSPAEDMHMLMPYNIMFRYPDAMAKQMYIHTGRMADMLSAEVASGTVKTPRFCPFTVGFSYLLRMQWFGA